MNQSADNLKTASTYINNLLLARGLLRNGTPIDFIALATSTSTATTEPSSAREENDDSAPGSRKERGGGGQLNKQNNSDNNNHHDGGDRVMLTAQTMNLVHDLILRRDKDQERQEQIATTLKTLRSETTDQRAEIDRLSSRNRMLESQLASAQTATRNARTALQSLESSARLLREEVARAKTTVQQVRSQCANDVRKRDVQIQRLKGHLSVQQRGAPPRAGSSSTASAAAAASHSVAPRCEIVSGPSGSRREDGAAAAEPSLEHIKHNLKQETTEFLTQLSAGLSEENSALVSLIRRTLTTLRELQGMPIVQRANKSIDHKASMLGSNGITSDDDGDGTVHVPPTSCDVLSRDIQRVLDSLKDLLTNPSFAPIEEVHVREEEIQRLREGWEKMENRWREAVHLMNGWRRRMLSGGNNIGLDELKLGLKLGEGLTGVGRVTDVGPSSEPVNPDDGFEDDLDEEDDDDDAEAQKDLPEIDDLPEVESAFGEEEEHDLKDLLVPVSRARPDLVQSVVLREATGNVENVAKPPQQISENGQENASPPKIEMEGKLHRPVKLDNVAREATKPHTTGKDSLRNKQYHSSSNAHKAVRAVEREMTVAEKLEFAAAEARRVSAGSDQRPISAPCSSSTSSRSSSPDLERPVSRVPLDESTRVDMASSNQNKPALPPGSSESKVSHASRVRGGANAKAKPGASNQLGTRAPSSTSPSSSAAATAVAAASKKHARSVSAATASVPAAKGAKNLTNDSKTARRGTISSAAKVGPKTLTTTAAAATKAPAKASAKPQPQPQPQQQRNVPTESPAPPSPPPPQQQQQQQKSGKEDEAAAAQLPTKRKRDTVSVDQKLAIGKKNRLSSSRNSRRRSTLRPDELSALMGLK